MYRFGMWWNLGFDIELTLEDPITGTVFGIGSGSGMSVSLAEFQWSGVDCGWRNISFNNLCSERHRL